MQRAGWPVERYEVVIKANKILNHHFGVPRSVGRGWYARFESRHHDLSARMAQKLSKARNAVTREGITRYFFDLVKAALGFTCTAGDIYNVDETSLQTKGSSKKVVAVRGSKNVWKGDQKSSYHLTIVAAVAADGTPVPPAFILPGKSCATTVLDTCPVADAMITSSPKSHLSVNSLPICEAYGICLVRIPANATHLLQPLDVALFRTFKRKISCGVTQCLQAMDSMTLPRDAAIKIAGEAFNTVFPAMDDPKKVNTAVANGFRTCGIWPLSLPRMLCRLKAAKKNGVKGSLGDDAWLKTQEFARDMALTLPPKQVGRKRVLTELNWHTRDGLRASAVQPKKRKK
ncbi:hypothetical protein DYB34_006000 [Aphanomyces astaci]|uniref:HTH CENPB-type domain-containing protein n=1 Tax=Aphanomyces astaci TaxID=112090 RepID=A0A418CDA3_APHAT|nr:hypothetical protein DYB34_006000 [Aphanomyces astaci]